MSDYSEQIRGMLNFSGFPFQHHCADKIARLDGYQVSAEVPFTDPPTNAARLGNHGSIDILAARPDLKGELLLCFVVECKRAKEETKNWILLPNKQQKPGWPTFIFSEARFDQPDVMAVDRGVAFPALGYGRGNEYDYCVNGIEVNAERTRQNPNQDEKVYKPLRQVTHAAHAFEWMFPKVIEGIDYLRPEKTHQKLLTIPVIITSANIYVPDFSPELVMQGDISPGNLALGDARKWTTYEFPLPDFLSYSLKRGDGGRTHVAKRTVFIVNDKFIDEFFMRALDVVSSGGKPSE
jgi:hypothetical protein